MRQRPSYKKESEKYEYMSTISNYTALPNETKVDIYCRVSSQEQAENGFSLDEQQRLCKEYADNNNIQILNICVDGGYSGATLERPALKKMLEDIKNKRIEKVIIYKLDRLSRRTRDVLMIVEDYMKPNNVALVSLSENLDTSTPAGMMYISVLSSFAQLERETIRDRMVMGKRSSLIKGNYMATEAPLGYSKKVEGKFTSLVPNEDADIVRLIFNMYNEGHGYGYIGTELDKIKKPARAEHWEKNTIRSILTNRVYIGEIGYGIGKNRVTLPNAHEKIIDLSLFESVNDKLGTNIHIRKDNALKGKYAGLIKCGCCGYAYKYDSSYNHNLEAYRCRNRHCKSKRKSIYLDDLDDIIINALKENLENIEVQLKEEEPEQTSIKADIARKKLSDLERKKERVYSLLEEGVYDAETFKNRISKLLEEEKELNNVINSTEVKPFKKDDIKRKSISLHKAIDELKDKNIDVKSKNDLLRALIDHIIVTGNNVEIGLR